METKKTKLFLILEEEHKNIITHIVEAENENEAKNMIFCQMSSIRLCKELTTSNKRTKVYNSKLISNVIKEQSRETKYMVYKRIDDSNFSQLSEIDTYDNCYQYLKEYRDMMIIEGKNPTEIDASDWVTYDNVQLGICTESFGKYCTGK